MININDFFHFQEPVHCHDWFPITNNQKQLPSKQWPVFDTHTKWRFVSVENDVPVDILSVCP